MNNRDHVVRKTVDDIKAFASYQSENIKNGLNKEKYYSAYYRTIEVYDSIQQYHLFLQVTYNMEYAERYLGKDLKKGTRLKNAMNNLINFGTN